MVILVKTALSNLNSLNMNFNGILFYFIILIVPFISKFGAITNYTEINSNVTHKTKKKTG